MKTKKLIGVLTMCGICSVALMGEEAFAKITTLIVKAVPGRDFSDTDDYQVKETINDRVYTVGSDNHTHYFYIDIPDDRGGGGIVNLSYLQPGGGVKCGISIDNNSDEPPTIQSQEGACPEDSRKYEDNNKKLTIQLGPPDTIRVKR